ncbi:helix-turn-helix transcriptional regulator [Amycolatopsis sp. NPDC051373]|uniref:helix-turn-helix domain-containing protein n=1 Tax=Amycolatopsis sp. NPDC051373 TaxID=3155801 RepID=UPI00344E9999
MEPEQDTHEANLLVQEMLEQELTDSDTSGAAHRFEEVIGLKIRELRIERGWSQTTVADRMRNLGFDLHQTAIAKIESGKRPIRANEVYALALVFGLPIQALWYLPVAGEPRSVEMLRHELEEVDKHIETMNESLQTLIGVYADAQTERMRLAKAMNEAAVEFQTQAREEDS